MEAAFEEGAFDRIFVSEGAIAYDPGESLAVEWEGTYPGSVGQPVGGAAITSRVQQFRAVFAVHACRETIVPDEVSTPPSAAAIQRIADLIHDDAEKVLRTVRKGLRDSTLFGSCGDAAVIHQVPIDPMGGIAGSVTRIEVSI